MSVKLISVTPDAEQTMAYVARVSNPNNQENPNYAKLLVIVSSTITGPYSNRVS
jgi:hypothetical protein